LVHSRTAREVSSVPLPLTIIAGRPRRAISASSSRTTRRPPIEVSTTKASASRMKSSTVARTRNRRPQDSTSATKSSDQRWFGPCGMVIGARVPVARLRPRRRRTVSSSSR
jgi:hypothetical protein